MKKNKVPIYNNITEKQIVIRYNKIPYKNKFNFLNYQNNIIDIITNGFYDFNDFLDGKKMKSIYLAEPKNNLL